MNSNKSTSTCFTIGHSTHSIEKFVELLQPYSIQAVVDIRSIPYSRHNPQYNRESLKKSLEKEGLSYIYMGNFLGAKYDLDLHNAREHNIFKKGIDRILRGLKKGFKLALMCAEKNPLKCHRFVLVSYALSEKGILVKHILSNGEVVLNSALEDRRE